MHSLRGWALSVALLAVVFASAGASAEDKWAPDEMTGVKVGEKAPDFTLKDQNGKEVALSDLVKQGTVALNFYRSANW